MFVPWRICCSEEILELFDIMRVNGESIKHLLVNKGAAYACYNLTQKHDRIPMRRVCNYGKTPNPATEDVHDCRKYQLQKKRTQWSVKTALSWTPQTGEYLRMLLCRTSRKTRHKR